MSPCSASPSAIVFTWIVINSKLASAWSYLDVDII